MKRMALTVILFVSFILINANQSYAFSEKLAEEVNNKSKNVAENIFPEEEYIEVERKVCIGTFALTGYCPCVACCGKSNGITASGTHATAYRTIAADTSRFPFGTRLIIGNNEYIVEDTGGTIIGNRIDVFFSSHSEALSFGKKQEEVYMFETTKFMRIDFREYMLITGDMLKNKSITCTIKDDQSIDWTNDKNYVIIKRIKNNDGTFYNYCDEKVYADWKKSRNY